MFYPEPEPKDIYTIFQVPLLLGVSKDTEDKLPGTVSVYSKMNIYFMKDDVLWQWKLSHPSILSLAIH